MSPSLLELKGLTKVFQTGLLSKTQTVALEDFSLSIPSENPVFITIAGESGSGKTTLANLILGFYTPTAGEVLYKGKNIWHMSRQEWRGYRREVQAVFQDPYEVYNPFYPVDHVFSSVVKKFGLAPNKQEARRITEKALEAVGLRPEEVLGKYPHHLSGGQRQRLMVARAFLLKPRLIVADEPVSMIDASLRGIVLDIMLQLKKEFGISFIYITHDLSTAYQISDYIYILYRGSIAEEGNIQQVIDDPKHPYTRLLLSSVPQPDPKVTWGDRLAFPVAEETAYGVKGCKFADRCPYIHEPCRIRTPALYQVGPQHKAACFLYQPSGTAGNSPQGT